MKKIMLLGDSGTGKSSILSYFLKDRRYPVNHYPTLGVQAGAKTIIYDNDEYGLIQFWDTAGKVHFHDEVCTKYYEGTDGFLIVINKQDKKTLDSIRDWLKKIKSVMGGKPYEVGILANKKDYEQNNAPLFTEKNVRTSYGDEMMYEQISLKDEDNEDLQKITNAEVAIRKFIRILYRDNLLKVVPQYQIDKEEDHPEQVNNCQCSIM